MRIRKSREKNVEFNKECNLFPQFNCMNSCQILNRIVMMIKYYTRNNHKLFADCIQFGGNAIIKRDAAGTVNIARSIRSSCLIRLRI